MRRQRWLAAVLTTGVLLCTGAVGAQAAVPTDASALRDAVTLGTREASTLGYQLSADYVAGPMEAAGYEVTREPFEYKYYEELAPAPVTGTSPGFRSRTRTA
jgi:hypothetical protein